MEDVAKDEYYILADAVKACEDLYATLWGIVDGEAEWNSVIEMAKKQNKASMWINGKVAGSCPGVNS